MTTTEFSLEEVKKKITHYGMSYTYLSKQIDLRLSSLSRYLTGSLKIPKSAQIRLVMYFNICELNKHIENLTTQLELAQAKIKHLEKKPVSMGEATYTV